MKINLRFRRIVITLFVLIGMSGCAALTIDVDVYKGPLANHEEVQIEQLTVMAIGAKPILVQLRNGLERKLVSHAGYVKNYPFKNKNAELVNSILGLYEDREYSDLPLEIEFVVKKIKKELGNFNQEKDLFFNNNYDEMKNIWNKFENAFRTKNEDGVNKFIEPEIDIAEDARKNKRKELNDQIKKLEAAYEKFFLPSNNKRGRNIQKIFTEHQNLITLFNSDSQFYNRPSSLTEFLGGRNISTAVEKYDVLSEKGNLKGHANILFGSDKTTIRKQFIDHITRVAGSFDKMRAAYGNLEKLLCENEDSLVEQLFSVDDRQIRRNFIDAVSLCERMNSIYSVYSNQLYDNSPEGPTFLKEFADLTTELTGKLKGPLDGGRLDVGLEEQIRTYLVGRFEGKKSNDEIRKNLKDLHVSLVHFAEKILFLANYDILLQSPEDFKLINIEGLNGSPQSDLESYVIVLQAVGNSILFQVDELRQKSDYEKNLDAKGPRELRALALALPKYSQQVLEKLIASLRDDALTSDDEIVGLLDLKNLQNSLENIKEKKKGEDRFTSIKDLIFNQAKKVGTVDTIKATLGTSTTITDIKAKYTKDLDDEINKEKGKPIPSLPRSKNLVSLKEFFENILPPSEIHPNDGTAVQIFVLIEAYLDKEINSAKADHKEALDKFNQLAELSGADVKHSFDEASQYLESKISSEKTKRKIAYEAVKENKYKIIAKLRDKGDVLGMDPKSLNAALTEVLTDVIKTSSMTPSSEDDKKIFKEGKDRVVKRSSQMDFPFEIPPQKAPDAKEVMDQLIASLRHEQIQAIREGGPKSGSVKNVEAALKAAYEQRAGLNYIRPAFSYLRNSFPSTSLQDDPSSGWKNMLTENMSRSLPFSEYLDPKRKKKENRRRINNEIDKQYWQNINRVRLTGGGDTNYVVAKDDLGNWYVKNYSAKPDDIIKSAKNLALFGMGSSMGTNLLAGAQETGEKAGDAVPEAQDGPRTPLERQFKKSKDKYDNQSKEALTEVKQIVTGLEGKIEKKWGDDASKFKSALGTAAENHLQEVKEASTEKGDPTDEIIKRLRAIKYFKNGLLLEIDQLSETTELTAKKKETAKGHVRSTVSQSVEKFLEERQEAVNKYETAIVFIGETASP